MRGMIVAAGPTEGVGRRLGTCSRAVVALAVFALGALVAPRAYAQACEAGCNQQCNVLPASQKKACKLSCFAGRCANPGALNVAEASGEPGISCDGDSACNDFCKDGPVADPDCSPFAFPPGYAGFAMEVYLDGVLQFFAPDQLFTFGDAAATQNTSGAVLLSVLACAAPEGCTAGGTASLGASFASAFPEGTTVNFKVRHVSGLPAPNIFGAYCQVIRLHPGGSGGTEVSFFSLASLESIGNHYTTLDVPATDGIRLQCVVS